jgi:hypothetical protein
VVYCHIVVGKKLGPYFFYDVFPPARVYTDACCEQEEDVYVDNTSYTPKPIFTFTTLRLSLGQHIIVMRSLLAGTLRFYGGSANCFFFLNYTNLVLEFTYTYKLIIQILKQKGVKLFLMKRNLY